MQMQYSTLHLENPNIGGGDNILAIEIRSLLARDEAEKNQKTPLSRQQQPYG